PPRRGGVPPRPSVARREPAPPIPFSPAAAREAWATFVFEAQPQAGLPIVVRWYRPDGKLLGEVRKPPNRASVSSFLRGRPRLPTGAWRAELRVGTKVVKQLRVPIGCTKC